MSSLSLLSMGCSFLFLSELCELFSFLASNYHHLVLITKMAFIYAERKQTHRSDHASFDIENPYSLMVNTKKKNLESLSPLSCECSIYKVSEYLHHINEKAYTPRVVSIGPLLHQRVLYLDIYGETTELSSLTKFYRKVLAGIHDKNQK